MKAIYGVDIEIGQNILDYMLVEEDRQIAKNNIDRTLAGESLINEAFSGDALHSRLYFEVKHNPIINTDGKIIGVAIKSEEITKRKQAEDKLKKSKSELEEYFENDISANYVVSIEGEIFSCNSTFLNMFGFKEKAHTKKIDITELYKKPDDRQELIRRIKTKGRVENYEVEFITRKGKTINAILNAIGIFNDSGELVQTRGYIVDITDRKKAEEELLKAKAKAEESDNLKTAFLANMSHEIRTPMNAILGFSQLLLSDTLKADEKKIFANYIQTNGENLVKIIDDIIDISKIQLKQLQVKMTDFDLHLMIKELEIYYTKILEQNSKNLIELKTEIPNKINDVFFIHSDALRLKQILNNLISNATKYTKKGQIVFGYKLVENEIHFFVKDTGVGIEAKNQTIIFDRFIQFSDEYIAREKGTGLGLPISKDLVALLAGELKVKSKKGKGSIFYFALPYVEIHPKIQNKNITRKKITDYNLSGNRILIVDDEESNFVLTKRILHDTKVKMDWANNGTKAVKMAENKKYSLIIMDIKMPIMDGIEATRRIKAHDKNIPIIIQTAFALDETKQQCIQAGCNDFVQKPISIEDFLTLVTKFILKNEELD
jgi:PAS domain S-box-containing protein